jgi:hypothetical protein
LPLYLVPNSCHFVAFSLSGPPFNAPIPTPYCADTKLLRLAWWNEGGEKCAEYLCDAGVLVMRLQDYSSFFRPEEFEAMKAAYDGAWRHLRTDNRSLTAKQVQILKKRLAQIILASACNGKRDVAQLKEIALRGISGRVLHRLGLLIPQLLPVSLLAS